MTWCHDAANDVVERNSPPLSSPRSKQQQQQQGKLDHGITTSSSSDDHRKVENNRPVIKSCPACGHHIKSVEQQQVRRINDLPGLPAGVRFDPTDQELLQHLEAKIKPELNYRLHPLIDEFIPTLEGENGICYTHPEKLPGVSKDGQVRHFFHRPSKAYTTGTRKRRKVHTDEEGCETRWHKTGKTRPVTAPGGKSLVKGYKKILVLYTNYGKQKKPEKTSWVMHQYHLGLDEEEREGELVVSKVFYQTQPRQCSGTTDRPIISLKMKGMMTTSAKPTTTGLNDAIGYPTSSSLISFEQRSSSNNTAPHGGVTNTGGNRGSSSSNTPTTTTAALFPFCCP